MKPACLILSIVLFLSCTKQEAPATEPELTYLESVCNYDGCSIPYCYALLNPQENRNPVVVLVLHGGPLKGNDNRKQLEEPATGIIASYLSEKGIAAVLLAPHCPERDNGGRLMNWVKLSGVLHELVLKYKTDDKISAYIFGASIGGVGTWNMLSTYPGLFAGAMPCASGPSGCNPENVALTRLYTVMGTDDTWAVLEKIQMQSFLDSVSEAGGTYRFDVGQGWDHETTCRESFTEERLDWVFENN
ncbi:MAG: hypothetical protein J5990_08215 [Bacteroidales bacterium]|nr:hypothetical protein [Bacteroidales bacterium]